MMVDVSKNASMEQHKASQEGLGIGQIITTEQNRDAIHVAIVPVKAESILYPGQRVGIKDGRASVAATTVGIIDPFLTAPVYQDQTCWLFLYPGTITSLRHVWTHPAFESQSDFTTAKTDIAASERWLRAFCEDADIPSYDNIMAALQSGGRWVAGDGYSSISIEDSSIHVGGQDAYGKIPSEFWDHVEVVLGRKVKSRPEYFSCSC